MLDWLTYVLECFRGGQSWGSLLGPLILVLFSVIVIIMKEKWDFTKQWCAGLYRIHNYLELFISICVCVCVHLCSGFSSVAFHHVGWERVSLNLEHVALARTAAQWVPGILFLLPQHCNRAYIYFVTWILYGCWGPELRSSCLCAQCLIDWAISPFLWVIK